MQEKTKVKIIGGAIARKGNKGIVTTAQGTGNNLGKVEIYIDRIGHFWYDAKDLEVIEEPPPPEPPKPKLINIKIKQIRIDGGTQIREKINQRTVEEYAEDMKQGASFPPIIVFRDEDGENWLSDGFHRVLAAAMANKNEILAEVHQGSLRDAILYSCGANATHGLRRSNKDKRNSVLRLLTDSEWTKFSNNQIAKTCGVSHTFVNKIRASLETVSSENVSTQPEMSLETNSSENVSTQPEMSLETNSSENVSTRPGMSLETVSSENVSSKSRTYVTKHGTIATMDTSNIGKSSGAELENTGNPAAGKKNKQYTSVKEELDDKQQELGLGKATGDSVMPETDRLDDLQHSNPTDIDDRPFANEPITKINPKSLVNNFAIHATELEKDDYRSIGKIITKAKPEAIEDVAEMMADTEEKALAIIEAINNKYPHLLRDEMF